MSSESESSASPVGHGAAKQIFEILAADRPRPIVEQPLLRESLVDELRQILLAVSDAAQAVRNAGRLHQVDDPVGENVDRKSVVKGKRVSVSVDLGGGRIIKKKNKRIKQRR